MSVHDRRPYLEFRDDDRILLGLTGPFQDRDKATTVMNALMQAEQMGVDGLDLDSVPPAAQCIFAPYQFVRVVDLSPRQIEQMTPGQSAPPGGEAVENSEDTVSDKDSVPDLPDWTNGSDRQQEWATGLRRETIAWTHRVARSYATEQVENPDLTDQFRKTAEALTSVLEDTIREQTSAQWWIEQRGASNWIAVRAAREAEAPMMGVQRRFVQHRDNDAVDRLDRWNR
jgi:hypothetical protein